MSKEKSFYYPHYFYNFRLYHVTILDISMALLENKFSFKLVSRKKRDAASITPEDQSKISEESIHDLDKRSFLKLLGIAGFGLAASQILPKKAEALIMGGTPSASTIGVKDASNTRVNPATEETLQNVLAGQGVSKITTSLSSSGSIHTPASGKKIRVYASRFSLTADATSISFRFTSGGTDHEKYLSPKTGGLYGSNNHPNYIEGGVDEDLYCEISGTTTIQINIDYLEI